MTLAKRTAFLEEELEALFKFIPSTKLLYLRQVSKEWDEAAKIVLPKRRDITLHLTTDNFDSRFNWKFLQFLNDSPENVFVAPVIHIENTNESNQDLKEGRICISFEIIGEICKRLGNRGIIKELIMEDKWKAPHFYADFILSLLGHLSSLEALEISNLQLSPVMTSEQNSENSPEFQLPTLNALKQINFRLEDSSYVEQTANFLRVILESSPNLENVAGWEWGLHKLNTISMLRDTGRLPKIKEVRIRKSADLDILLQCKPKIVLHSLQIYVEDNDVCDSKKLFTFLQQQAVNLKRFKCNGNISVPKSIFTLPLLPKLEKLSFIPRDDGCLLSVNYGRHTPALKTFKISSENLNSCEEFLPEEMSDEDERPPCLSLEKLDLFMSCGSYQRMFDNWKNIFPNLKKLTLENPEGFDFDQASKCWPQLEELNLEIHVGYHKHDPEYKNLDAIVFGIKGNRDYWEKIGKIDKTEEDWWMKIPSPEIKGTVASFKNLQKLDIIIHGVAGTLYLTDFAVYFGIQHMQNLKELVIFVELGIDHGYGVQMENLPTEAFNFLVTNLPNLEKLSLEEQNWERGEILK